MAPRHPPLSTSSPSPAPRLGIVDAVRGFAVAQMIVYHFLYDLDYFGWLTLHMLSDLRWVTWRNAIVSQFLLLVGVSLVLRAAFKPRPSDFWKRWAQVAAAAALVSLGSFVLFGSRFIWFGILHFVAAALILARPFVRLGTWNFAAGAALVLLALTVSHPFFDRAPYSAIGLVTAKPLTEDYVPLLPWFGVVLVGIGFGSFWKTRQFAIPTAIAKVADSPPRVLALLGTWALTVYLVHQPILMGILALVRRLTT